MIHKLLLRYCLLILAALPLCSQSLWAHKEWVHQWIVQQAYQFLENEVGEIPELKSYLGYNYWGKHGNRPESPWESNESIVVGAWQEDMIDAVWAYGGFTTGLDASISHFWNGENDNSLGPFGQNNAWKKARMFIFGKDEDPSFKIYIDGKYMFTEPSGRWVRILGKYYTYQNLCEFYHSGNSSWLGYRDLQERLYLTPSPVASVIVPETRKKWVYNIIGRIAHLLADMSVPAHTHLDTHPCAFGDGDAYELWMGNNLDIPVWESCNAEKHYNEINARHWTAATARAQGGLITEIFSGNDYEAIRHLFYTTNRLAAHWPSQDENGQVDEAGSNTLHGWGSPYLVHRHAMLGAPPSLLINSTDEDYRKIADESFNYAIRATATMFYWFSIKFGLIECPANLYIQNEFIWGRPWNNSTPQSHMMSFDAEHYLVAGENVRSSPYPAGQVLINGGRVPGTQDAPAHVEFRAGDEVQLKPGFWVERGAIFHAYIDNECRNYNSCSVTPNMISTESSAYCTSWLQVNTTKATIVIPSNASVVITSNGNVILSDFEILEPTNATVTTDTTGNNVYIYTPIYGSSIVTYTSQATLMTTTGTILMSFSSQSTISVQVDGSLVISNSNQLKMPASSYSFNDTDTFPLIQEEELPSLISTPNPFIDRTNIEYMVTVPSMVTLTVYNALGMPVAELLNVQTHKVGRFKIEFNATSLPRGIYYCTLRTAHSTQTCKMVIVE